MGAQQIGKSRTELQSVISQAWFSVLDLRESHSAGLWLVMVVKVTPGITSEAFMPLDMFYLGIIPSSSGQPNCIQRHMGSTCGRKSSRKTDDRGMG